MQVARIAHRWAGLRSFVADRVPTAGFAPDAPGFFWLAGQGGYGFQTAPAMAAIVEALVTGGDWPAGLAELGVTGTGSSRAGCFEPELHPSFQRKLQNPQFLLKIREFQLSLE